MGSYGRRSGKYILALESAQVAVSPWNNVLHDVGGKRRQYSIEPRLPC